MSIKNPYFPKAPLVAREFIGTPYPYSLIFYYPENKGIRAGVIGVTSAATKGAFEDKGFNRKGIGHRPAPALGHQDSNNLCGSLWFSVFLCVTKNKLHREPQRRHREPQKNPRKSVLSAFKKTASGIMQLTGQKRMINANFVPSGTLCW